ncbi:MAG TPA: tetratricopeptide repeat protein [Saprospiraceae bacterium]|nr:tetratricopeptide repeat protein [Saprospiraceae bacterium]
MAKKKTHTKKASVKKRPSAPEDRIGTFEWLPLLGVLTVTIACFARTFGYDFVNWDDDFNIAENPNLRYFDWANIKGIFTSHVIGNYNPLTIFTFAVENHFFGLKPGVFHATNVLLHAGCVFFFYRLVRLLGLSLWPAVVAALIFGIHPMRIESVAWVTERKDVLFGIFYLAALVQYVKWYKSGYQRKYMIWILVLFVLSLLSKIQAVALPLSMLAIDFLLARKIQWKLLIEKIPYFILSLAFGLLGIYFLSQQGSLDSTAQYNLLQRVVVGMHSFVIYLIKFLVPYRISPLYPYPAVLPWYVYISPVMIAGIVWLFWKAWQRRWRPFVFGVAFFTVNIAFVLQVVGAGQGFLADRFTYIPYVGLIFTVVSYGDQWRRSGHHRSRYAIPITTIWLLALIAQTWIHVPIWKHSGALWTHVLNYYQNTALPYRNRAQYYRDLKQYDLALADYDRSIALKKDGDVINSRARMYFDQQKWREAIADYNLAIEAKPTGEFYINRGAAYAMIGNMQNALNDMTEGLRLDPAFPNGYKNRSLVYQSLGQIENAQSDLLKYLDLNPYDADIWYESGRLYRMLNNERQALTAFDRAISLAQKGVYFLERAKSHLVLGNKTQARQDLQTAEQMGAQIDPQTRAQFQ